MRWMMSFICSRDTGRIMARRGLELRGEEGQSLTSSKRSVCVFFFLERSIVIRVCCGSHNRSRVLGSKKSPELLAFAKIPRCVRP